MGETMHRTTKATTLIASLGVAVLAFAGCASTATESPAPDETVTVDSAPIEDAPAEATFENSVLTTEDVTITITDTKTIPVGEPGNEYGDVPVIAFW